jgi:hypothetical protein
MRPKTSDNPRIKYRKCCLFSEGEDIIKPPVPGVHSETGEITAAGMNTMAVYHQYSKKPLFIPCSVHDPSACNMYAISIQLPSEYLSTFPTGSQKIYRSDTGEREIKKDRMIRKL